MADVEALAERVSSSTTARCSSTALWGPRRALLATQDGHRRPRARRRRLRALRRGRRHRRTACDPARTEDRSGCRHGSPAGGTAGRRSFRERPAHRRGHRHCLQQRRGAGESRPLQTSNPCLHPSRNPCRYDRSPHLYRAQFKTTIAEQFQYRGALVIWLIGLILEPVIYLSVWSTVARSQGGSVDGFNPRTSPRTI